MSSTNAPGGCSPCSSSTPGLHEVSDERSAEAPSGRPIGARLVTVKKGKKLTNVNGRFRQTQLKSHKLKFLKTSLYHRFQCCSRLMQFLKKPWSVSNWSSSIIPKFTIGEKRKCRRRRRSSRYVWRIRRRVGRSWCCDWQTLSGLRLSCVSG